MSELTRLPNIRKTFNDKLELIGISSEKELKSLGSKDAIIKISTIENSGSCINMLYAIEGAIQGIRWHNLNEDIKIELKDFYNSMLK